jgi:hypothetical protein
MIFFILYIIFSRINNYYTVTIYDNQIIDLIMEYNIKSNVFTKNSNYIEFGKKSENIFIQRIYDNYDLIYYI